jgi:hypothetical protein
LVGAAVLAYPFFFAAGWKDWMFMEAGPVFGGGVMWLCARIN